MTPDHIPPVSDETLAELLELEAKATPGDWQWGYGYSDVLCEEGILDSNGHAVSVNCGRGSGDITPEDASLVISSRNSLRSIARELQERRAAEKKEYGLLDVNACDTRVMSESHVDRWVECFPGFYRKQYRIAAGPWIDAEPSHAEKETR